MPALSPKSMQDVAFPRPHAGPKNPLHRERNVEQTFHFPCVLCQNLPNHLLGNIQFIGEYSNSQSTIRSHNLTNFLNCWPKLARMFLNILECSKMLDNVVEYSRRFENVLECSKCSRIFYNVPDGSGPSKGLPVLEHSRTF